MRLATTVTPSADMAPVGRRVGELERAGLDVVWVGESYGFDAVSALGYLAGGTSRVELGTGILNVFSRTPALLAMTAAGLDAVSDGRFILGLGVSGPQIVEGLHAVPFSRPADRVGEVIDLCRLAWRREPMVSDGVVKVPLPRGEGSGLGRPMKLMGGLRRARVPIYVAGLGDRMVETAAERADGWLPLFFVPERAADVWGESLRRGGERRAEDQPSLEIVAGGPLAFIEDATELARLRDAFRPMLALYVGGMGPKGRNFYNSLVRRYGYEEAADKVQDLFLEGRREDAERALPDELVERMTLIGPPGYVAERVTAYREAGVTCLNVDLVGGGDAAATVARLREIVDP
jgi:F420-dependent oxidoreductase-like protein